MAVHTPGLLSAFLRKGLGRSWDLSQGQEKDLEAAFMKRAQKRGGMNGDGDEALHRPSAGHRGGGRGVKKQQNQLSNDALELPLRLEAEGNFFISSKPPLNSQ